MDPHATALFRAAIVARARLIEDLVTEQADGGLTQYAILGAGPRLAVPGAGGDGRGLVGAAGALSSGGVGPAVRAPGAPSAPRSTGCGGARIGPWRIRRCRRRRRREDLTIRPHQEGT
ncbi:class I SAM-dependent methyltransferase [Streptomyces sp. DW4-2]|uniref:Class I SAM-dependent methyltransferase n=1 Tax=Streptomyces spirodelae TaxID=2812904 RepID=A0ABS3WLW1_9ACTN|nr:class I SAM-dependent methyltransferase [Streptomyces spirodelae]